MRECDRLAEALIKAVRDIYSGDNELLQARFKVVRLLHHSFQVGGTSNNDAADVDSVICDEVLSGELAALNDV